MYFLSLDLPLGWICSFHCVDRGDCAVGVLLHVVAHEGKRCVHFAAHTDDRGPVQSGCPQGSSFSLSSRLGIGRIWRLSSELFFYRNTDWRRSSIPSHRPFLPRT